MATGKRYYWMKLKESFMTSDTIDYFMSQPNGANYVVLYQMLCLKTINTNGRLSRQIGEVIIPYDIPKIQRDLKYFTADTIRVALELYKAFGLIYEDQDGVLVLADHDGLVGSETNWKEQKRAQREKKLPKLTEGRRLNANTLLLPTGKTQNVDEKRYGGNGMLAFDLAGYRCEMCGANEDLLIHHSNGYSNDIEDLFILCTRCHGIAHAPGTPEDWLRHNRKQTGGQAGGHVHPDIEIDIRDRKVVVDARAREPDSIPPFGKVMSYLMDNIDSDPSSLTIDGVKMFLEKGLDPDVIIHAMEIARSEKHTGWAYIRGILRRYARDGLTTMRAVLDEEERHEAGKGDRHGSGKTDESDADADRRWGIEYDA